MQDRIWKATNLWFVTRWYNAKKNYLRSKTENATNYLHKKSSRDTKTDKYTTGNYWAVNVIENCELGLCCLHCHDFKAAWWRYCTWTEHVLVCRSGFVRLLLVDFAGVGHCLWYGCRLERRCLDALTVASTFMTSGIFLSMSPLYPWAAFLGWPLFIFTEEILDCFGSLGLVSLTQKGVLGHGSWCKSLLGIGKVAPPLSVSFSKCVCEAARFSARLVRLIEKETDTQKCALLDLFICICSIFIEEWCQILNRMHGYDPCTDSVRSLKRSWVTDIQKRRTSISVISTHSIRSRSSSSTLGLKYTSFQHSPSVPIGFCTEHPMPSGTKSCEVVLSPFPCRAAIVCLFSWSWGTSILLVLAVLRAQRCLVQCLVLLSCLTQKQSFDSSSPVFRSLCRLPVLVLLHPKTFTPS